MIQKLIELHKKDNKERKISTSKILMLDKQIHQIQLYFIY